MGANAEIYEFIADHGLQEILEAIIEYFRQNSGYLLTINDFISELEQIEE